MPNVIRMLDAFGGDGEKASAAVGGANLAIKTVREVILASIEANHRGAPRSCASTVTRSGITSTIRWAIRRSTASVPKRCRAGLHACAPSAWPCQLASPEDSCASRPGLGDHVVDQDRLLSPKTIRNLHGLLSASMEWAVQ